MKKIYITGVSGTGKTTLVTEFNKRGIFAIDIDSTDGLCNWRNKITKEKTGLGVGKEWLDAHEWFCDEDKLKDLVDNSNQEIVIVCGMPMNQDDFLDFFDKIFVLQCNEETFLNRINTRTDNDFGKEEAEREFMLGLYQDFEQDLINSGAISINTERPIETVADDILSKI